MNIVITGAKGSGKTTVGAALHVMAWWLRRWWGSRLVFAAPALGLLAAWLAVRCQLLADVTLDWIESSDSLSALRQITQSGSERLSC